MTSVRIQGHLVGPVKKPVADRIQGLTDRILVIGAASVGGEDECAVALTSSDVLFVTRGDVGRYAVGEIDAWTRSSISVAGRTIPIRWYDSDKWNEFSQAMTQRRTAPSAPAAAGGTRKCIFIGCPLRGTPTQLERCPECRRETQVFKGGAAVPGLPLADSETHDGIRLDGALASLVGRVSIDGLHVGRLHLQVPVTAVAFMTYAGPDRSGPAKSTALAHHFETRSRAPFVVATTIWDGPMLEIEVEATDLEQTAAALDAVVARVAVTNAEWPMSTARAAAVRASCGPGLFRTQRILGPQGLAEFWTALDTMEPELGQLWRSRTGPGNWPVHACLATSSGRQLLLGLQPEQALLLDLQNPDGDSQFPYGLLHNLEVTAPDPATGYRQGWHLRSLDGQDLVVEPLDASLVPTVYRFMLRRWGALMPVPEDDWLSQLEGLAQRCDEGTLSAAALSDLASSLAQRAAGSALAASTFPVAEEAYLKPPPPAETTPKAPPAGQPRPPRAPRPAQPPAKAKPSGPSPRQVAAGAAGIAALAHLLSDM